MNSYLICAVKNEDRSRKDLVGKFPFKCIASGESISTRQLYKDVARLTIPR